MTCILKPSRVSLYINKDKKTITQIKAETGCDAVINGGLYDMASFSPVCHLKADGKVLSSDGYKYWGYGWNETGLQLMTEYDSAANYISCVCMVREGKAEKMYYGSGIGGSRPRTAIGTFPDGRVWLYAGTSGKTPEQLQQTALEAGVRDAVMLDGGCSTQCIFPDGKVTSSRRVHNYICLWTGEPASKEEEKMKIYLSPSAQSENLYAAGNTNEQIQCNLIADAAKTALERCGFEVKKAPAGQSYQKNTAESNVWGADLHVPIHTNAGGGYGPVVLVYRKAAKNTKYATPVYEALSAIVPKDGNRGVQANPGLYEVTNTKAVCVYCECEFHDNAALARWIINHVTDIGEAICKGICQGAGVSYIEDNAQKTIPSEKTVEERLSALESWAVNLGFEA